MTSTPHDPDVIFVDEPTAVADALATLDGEIVGVDVERADADNYFRRAALVQVGVPGRCLLLDGVTIDAMDALDAFLDGTHLAVLHAVENDLEPLARKGVRADRLADTAVAAGLLGLPIGLGGLLREVLEVELTEDKERFQRADWEQRPLPDDMAGYAAGDVVHLPALWRELDDRLADAGRRTWYEQELDFTLRRAEEATRDWTRVKGAGRLSPEAKAVLKALWEAREALARTHDIAPNRLLHDDVLRALAEEPPTSEADLVRRSPRRRRQLREHAEHLFAAVEDARRSGPLEVEVEPRRWSPQDKGAYDAMRKARAAVASDLGLEPGVVCSSRPLWRAVAAQPDDGDELCSAADLRPWQSDLLREVLWDAYAEATVRDDVTA